jgi:hypothetical protein
VIGAAQLPCEYFVIAVVADDVEAGEPTRYKSRLLLVSDGFVVRGEVSVGEAEMRGLGADAVSLLRRERNEIQFRSAEGTMHLYLAQRAGGELTVAGRIIRDEMGTYSAFETRTDRVGLETFADGLKHFPHASS